MTLTPEQAKAILQQHNDYRRQEGAANMYMLHWNTSLQQRADAWIQGCNFKHEFNMDLGENLFFTTDHNDAFFLGVKAWHDEKSLWSYSSGNCGAACHYTQIIWSWTITVGCSAKVCPSLTASSGSVKDALFLACYYYPR
ncbi:cysteine-rich secretory protein lccl domain-containing 2 [Plakobranchus ocellatus]|uniref:Cysteine-rich secretory protein lccl domain-containing 2 n=1 Tax=Plakobranchus ocellatus TaxID=259542 RepID=A0AAV4AA47_9GAST|nr:cysteine-rich secretory protein lccl domain-containing 2 [Plakobranchus ocellatus]